MVLRVPNQVPSSTNLPTVSYCKKPKGSWLIGSIHLLEEFIDKQGTAGREAASLLFVQGSVLNNIMCAPSASGFIVVFGA